MASPMRVYRGIMCAVLQREKSLVHISMVPCCKRCFSSQQSDEGADFVQQPGKLRRYLVDKMLTIVNSSTAALEKASPSVFQIYKTFKTGLKGFVTDSREYYRVTTELWSGRAVKDLSRRELEILREVPRDFLRVAPLLLLTLVPGGSIAFPIAYVFPRQLLSYHFWTDQQRNTFWQHELKHRLQHMQPILDNMLLMSRHIKDDAMEQRIVRVANKLRHSVHVTCQEVLTVKPLFESYPYNLDRISITYSRHLSKLMSMSLRRRLLKHDAMLLHYTDMAMQQEGILGLSDIELERACFWRGLNPVGLSRRDQLHYLQHWLEISQTLHEEGMSLLLHLPLFFAFCHPTNRELMGGWRSKFHLPGR